MAPKILAFFYQSFLVNTGSLKLC